MFNIDDIKSIKKAIRVDHDFDDDLIKYVYLPSAIKEVKTAVSLKEDAPFFFNNTVFNLAVLNIVAHHYDNRSTTSNEQSFDMPSSSMKLVQTLRSDLVKWRQDNIEVTNNEP
ncbi:head-tail connector protein [Staphylococcus simiae]|uniref:DNA packaging protein n=1 Tax=Staphylococcus simiae CCM 7213 = CCUG 51256 TaxID=911238 RepID=G5JH86_9STAP|nr:head-tail connector protein [Staphylococcus simiae]EHJ08434.1 hypothetical protein SS7213T_04075 [Staphylococcus simiae CCM 7213 = CCUG 51256]PNZ12540.1 phage gp6-like head-tail connector protein [Staphylococcus simiae]SNV67325.1 uncharacterized phage protein (possible DNA packaging) [Staphylococcus simiae]